MVLLVVDPPPVVATVPAPKPPEPVVVSSDKRSELLVSRDTPLALVKGGRTEDALLRQSIFMTVTLTVLRPAEGAGGQTLRWDYKSYLQHQLCFTSMTGQFSCTAADLEDLTETAEGEAPLAAPSSGSTPARSPTAEEARVAVATALGVRADSLFEADRLRKLDPMLKAAGVQVRPAQVAKASARR